MRSVHKTEGRPSSNNVRRAEDRIYAAIGRVVCAWAGFEDELFKFFYRIMPGSKEEECAAIYFAFSRFDQRMSFINELMKTKFAARDELIFWNDIYVAALELSRQRNFIAHNEVAIYYEVKSKKGMVLFDELRQSYKYYRLTIPEYRQKHKNKKLQNLSADDIEKISSATHILKVYFGGFGVYLTGRHKTAGDERYKGHLDDHFLKQYILGQKNSAHEKR